MIEADQFIDPAGRHGFDFYTGVPCSYLTPLINGMISDHSLRYVGAASEGEAVAIAAGAWLAGRRTVVMCQNSGLGNAVNPLTSLNAPFRIPTLFITTWRGEPGLKDEPQHEVMGEVTGDILDRHPHSRTACSRPRPRRQSPRRWIRRSRPMGLRDLPFAFIMAKGSVRDL